MVLTALNENGLAIRYASDNLKNDKVKSLKKN